MHSLCLRSKNLHNGLLHTLLNLLEGAIYNDIDSMCIGHLVSKPHAYDCRQACFVTEVLSALAAEVDYSSLISFIFIAK